MFFVSSKCISFLRNAACYLSGTPTGIGYELLYRDGLSQELLQPRAPCFCLCRLASDHSNNAMPYRIHLRDRKWIEMNTSSQMIGIYPPCLLCPADHYFFLLDQNFFSRAVIILRTSFCNLNFCYQHSRKNAIVILTRTFRRILQGCQVTYWKTRINRYKEVEMEVPPMVEEFQSGILRKLRKPQGGIHEQW